MEFSQYSEAFFADNMLVIVTVNEGSGSTRHKVLSVSSDGEIVIERELAQIGTADMAQWKIVIELAKSTAPQEFTLDLRTVTAAE
jgi:hypothetical protein